MPWRTFAFWNAAGAITWAAGIGLAAYYLGQSTAGTVALFGVAGVVSLLAIPGLWVAHRRQQQASQALPLAAPEPWTSGAEPELLPPEYATKDGTQ
jgi:hypothetical protein